MQDRGVSELCWMLYALSNDLSDSREYLHHLQHLNKWHKCSDNIIVGTLVLIKNDLLPAIIWTLEKTVQIYLGDGLVRVITVKTANSLLRRLFSKIYPLPVQSEEEVNNNVKKWVQ